MRTILAIPLAALFLILAGCVSPGATPAQKRESIAVMENQVLAELYGAKPDVRAQIAEAPGYAVFSNVNLNLLVASFGGGRGIVHDNRSGASTYMRMAEVGVGFGAGVKDFRAVFVFHTDQALERFVSDGWAFGAQADAAAKASDLGAAAAGEAVIDNVTIYSLTETGLALQATVKGTKFWPDDELN